MIKLVHSQAAEDCKTPPLKRRWNVGLIVALLLMLAFDVAAGFVLYKLYTAREQGYEKLL